ncbi:MAG TPA: NF038122 family metalloprotease [Candidatus Acidoferrales bacterium]|nr:NF038122 family metalloprotease [Candidatus Acidoferrales bacterium]
MQEADSVRHLLSVPALLVLGQVMSLPLHANPIFNITYTASVQADTNFANIQSAVNYVTNEYSSLFTDNVTLNFIVDEGAVGLGQSLFSNNYWRGSYSQLRTALVNDVKTTDDATAMAPANLPASAPYADACGLANDCWYATSAEAKALGLITNQSVFDGTFTFDNTTSFTYDPNNRGVAGKYDFIGVAEHEFSELMGRTAQSTAFGYNILDTMRFTSTGSRDLNQDSDVYFSFDNGNTHMAVYNPIVGGDRQDLNGAVATDPYNAYSWTNQAHSLNSVDISTMDVIGWDRTSASPVPEPAPAMVVAPVLLGMAIAIRRRAQQVR